MKFSTKPSRREILWGGIYLVLYCTILPWLVPLLAQLSGADLDAVQVNFIYFTLNFGATTVIFRKYFLQSLSDAMNAPGPALWYGILSYLGSQTLSTFVVIFILQLEPDFANVNDAAINAMASENYPLMFLGTVVMAPITEELLFRGLLFRGLYDRSPLAAHLVTMVLFSLIHVTGYIGFYEPKILLLCFIQYLPAAYCLNFAYRYGGSIASPILMHILTNLLAMSAMR